MCDGSGQHVLTVNLHLAVMSAQIHIGRPIGSHRSPFLYKYILFNQ